MSEDDVTLGKRHPLLLYRRLASYWRVPLMSLLLVSLGLLIWNHPALRDLRLVLAVILLSSLVLLLLTFIMSRLAWVQCRADGIYIHLPLHQLLVPYESVIETRAAFMYALFPPSEQPSSTLGFLNPLWRSSAVVIRLRALPRPRRQLRLWMDSRMVVVDGLVLLVKDYMGFRREIQHAMIQWRAAIGDS